MALSMIFWGPPGTGKTTLGKLIAGYCDMEFITISAVLAGVKEVRAAVTKAQQLSQEHGKRTILFVDEVHRFNKSQQDAFLPYVEDGTFTFIGATTENPSFELNNALLSRARVYVLQALQTNDLREIIDRAMNDEPLGLAGRGIDFPEPLRDELANAADGDGRRVLNLLEIAIDLADSKGQTEVDEADLAEVLSGTLRRFDKGGEAFYDQISALHKSVRGSAPDAALYWLCRMLDGGCDPVYLMRRIVRMASEDIGNADPRGLRIALDAWESFEKLGRPEGELAIAQAVVYLASAPKSNAVYTAFKAAMHDVKAMGSVEVPIHLRNAPTKLMSELGYGKEYRYAHDEPGAYAAGENYFPEAMPERAYYHPVNRGLEIQIGEKLKRLKELDKDARSK
jgi:putative ATPase